MKKLIFLFVSKDKFPPFRVDVAVLFKDKMISRGHRIDWILQSEAPTKQPKIIIWEGDKVFLGATDNGTSKIKRLKKHIHRICNDFNMFSAFKKKQYDFILVKDLIISALIAIITSKINKSKLVYWLSYPFPESAIYEVQNGTARFPMLYWIRGHITKLILYRVILPIVDHIFVQSDQMKIDIIKEGAIEKKITPVPMGVSIKNIPFFNYDKKKDDKKEKIILYLGTLIKIRRMTFLVKVLNIVLGQFKDTKLYLVGGGQEPSDEQIIIDEARKNGIEDKIVITGNLPQKEAWQYVKEADVCLSPYYPIPILNSTSPTKIIEYMAMGKAVVANDHPEQKLVLEESGAGICVPYDEKKFADAIILLLRDKKKAQIMGTLGRKYAEEKRDYEKIANIVEDQLLLLTDRS
ncbi:glycosyltransferase [candidate division WS5 bacterium]|uniref:Glycosyltransferase n=1 Tax=candidate division WS5 bacterium TaxID=2093353 RepID=A0A419DAT9_9BACT|nr:MAG: glycosyltransferase [candidate division WS5 bacterium]